MDRIDIYIAMLSLALPYIRNVQSQGVFRKAFDQSCGHEAELLHNIVGSLHEKQIGSQDIHFLNYQARHYLHQANAEICPNYAAHRQYIRKLFDLVPDKLKSQLTWQGPV